MDCHLMSMAGLSAHNLNSELYYCTSMNQFTEYCTVAFEYHELTKDENLC